MNNLAGEGKKPAGERRLTIPWQSRTMPIFAAQLFNRSPATSYLPEGASQNRPIVGLLP